MSEHDVNQNPQSPGNDPDTEPRLDLSFTRSTREVATAALVGALIAVVTLVVLYFSFREDVSSYGRQIDTLDARLTQQVRAMESDMSDRVAALEAKVEDMENLPRMMRAMALEDALREMRARAAFLEGQVDDPQVRAKLRELDGILREVEAGIQP